MHQPRMSDSHPIEIQHVHPAGAAGRIGMTFCPGKKQRGAETGDWDRDLGADLARIAGWGAAAVVSVIEDHELAALAVPDLPARAEAAGLEHHLLPVPDGGTPDARAEARWAYTGERVRQHLGAGHDVVVHCKGGLGRTGTFAARLLVEFGATPRDARRAPERSRRGTRCAMSRAADPSRAPATRSRGARACSAACWAAAPVTCSATRWSSPRSSRSRRVTGRSGCASRCGWTASSWCRTTRR